jgi:hypothetical protein
MSPLPRGTPTAFGTSRVWRSPKPPRKHAKHQATVARFDDRHAANGAAALGRRASARRASSRRATARERKDDVEGRIIEYLKDHPRSTTGDIAKALNANRDTIAATSRFPRSPEAGRLAGNRVARRWAEG